MRDGGASRRLGGRFFGDGHRVGKLARTRSVLKRRRNAVASRFSLPPWTLGIHSPGIAVVVEVDDRRDRVDAQAVDVKFAQPEERAREQKVGDFGAAEVECEGAPLVVEAFARVERVRRGCVPSKRPRLKSSVGKWPGTQSRITPSPALCAALDERARSRRACRSGSSVRTSRWSDSPTNRRRDVR